LEAVEAGGNIGVASAPTDKESPVAGTNPFGGGSILLTGVEVAVVNYYSACLEAINEAVNPEDD
jgi:hypothetical protein